MRREAAGGCVVLLLFALLLGPDAARAVRGQGRMDRWLLRSPGGGPKKMPERGASEQGGGAARKRARTGANASPRSGKWDAELLQTPSGLVICPICRMNVHWTLQDSHVVECLQLLESGKRRGETGTCRTEPAPPAASPRATDASPWPPLAQKVKHAAPAAEVITRRDEKEKAAGQTAAKERPSWSDEKGKAAGQTVAKERPNWWEQTAQRQQRLEQPLKGSWWEKSSTHLQVLQEKETMPNLSVFDVETQDLNAGLKLQPTAISQVPGLYQFQNFIDEAEEARLLEMLEADGRDRWIRSKFSGECESQGWGVRTDHVLGSVRPNIPERGERDLPPYLWQIVERWQARCATSVLRHWTPNEANANRYETARGSFLTAHFDDRKLSGDILVNLSLSSSCVMTFENPTEKKKVRVPLPQRSLQVVSGDARYKYTHAIEKGDFDGPVRISITFRKAQLTAGTGKRPGRLR